MYQILEMAGSKQCLPTPQDKRLQYDYFSGDPDPTPSFSEQHGTSVAGVIAMAKDNAECGVGVAYMSTITGQHQ